MLEVFCVLAFVGIPVQAVRGKGHRSLYASTALAALIFGCILLWMANTSSGDISALSASQLAGTEVITEYFPSVATWLLVVCIASILAAVVFRQPRLPLPGRPDPWRR
jgi:hypothetical protein